MTKKIIVWDLGGTKCSAGVVVCQPESNTIDCQQRATIKLSQTTSLEDLIQQLERDLGVAFSEVDAICIGAAGQYDNGFLLLENGYPYPMPFASVAKKLKWPRFEVIHDYAPIVCATFTSYMQDPKNILRLNQCEMNSQGRRVALGIGTGLGLKDGVLFSDGNFWLGKNEIGHIGITTPPNGSKHQLDRHKAFNHFLHEHLFLKANQPLTFETVLSGQGTVRLYQFFYGDSEPVTPEQVGIKMRDGSVPEMLDAFAWYVGLFVGTVQLIFMPEGGVWLTGGVALSHLEVFERQDFYDGIKASPAYLSQREHYPLGVLCNPEHALIGGGYYAARRLVAAA